MLWRLWAKSGCESKPKLPLLPAALLARSRRIERVFAKIKTLLRKVDERTIASVLAWMQLLRAGECGANDGQQIAANPTIGIDSRQVTMSPPTRPAKSSGCQREPDGCLTQSRPVPNEIDPQESG